MLLDGHIHVEKIGDPEKQRPVLLKKMREANLDGGVLLSVNPLQNPDAGAKERIAHVTALCGEEPFLFPFFWVNPLDEDALDQVELACSMKIRGIKIVCSQVYPRDERVLNICRRAAEHNLPVLFHSGVLWDGLDSARYNRPGEFECLLDVPNLRFTLAHVSWPWCDECIATYGKFANAYSLRPDLSCEMFMDITPGTPKMYREEVLKKLYCIGYDVLHNVIFGTDCNTENYNAHWANDWMEYDRHILECLDLPDTESVFEHLYAQNLLRFLGESDEKVTKEIPMVAE